MQWVHSVVIQHYNGCVMTRNTKNKFGIVRRVATDLIVWITESNAIRAEFIVVCILKWGIAK